MRAIRTVLFLLIIAAALCLAAGCGAKGNLQDRPSGESGAAGRREAELVSVTYSSTGAGVPNEEFSYYLFKEGGKATLRASYCGADGESRQTECAVSGEEMERLETIFEKYGYRSLVGKRDGGGDITKDETYYFSAQYSDGKSFSADSAGDGAHELRTFFEVITGNNG